MNEFILRINVDTQAGTAGTEPYVNGTPDNPALTWGDALTLAAALGITDFHILTDETNVRLIAAAPDLLDAATLAIACMAMDGEHASHDAPCWLDALTIAHAKATL